MLSRNTPTPTARSTPTGRHLFAIVDGAQADPAAIEIAKDAVEHGDRVTVLVRLDRADDQHIRDYAESERLSVGEAEQRYVEATEDAVRSRNGGDVSTTVQRGRHLRRDVVDRAVEADATSIAVPAKLARRRRWQRALGHAGVPVIVTPPSAA